MGKGINSSALVLPNQCTKKLLMADVNNTKNREETVISCLDDEVLGCQCLCFAFITFVSPIIFVFLLQSFFCSIQYFFMRSDCFLLSCWLQVLVVIFLHVRVSLVILFLLFSFFLFILLSTVRRFLLSLLLFL